MPLSQARTWGDSREAPKVMLAASRACWRATLASAVVAPALSLGRAAAPTQLAKAANICSPVIVAGSQKACSCCCGVWYPGFG